MNDPSASGKHDFMLRTALWELSQCFSGGMGWVASLYLMMTKLAPRTTAWSKVPLFSARRQTTAPEAHPLAQATGPRKESPHRAMLQAVHVADCAALTIPIGTIWMIGIGSGTVIGLLSASLFLMGTPDAADLARKIFVVYFESMQAALGIATIRATACAKSPPPI